MRISIIVLTSSLILFLNAHIANSNEIKSKTDDRGLYGFVTYGVAKHNAGVTSTASSGTISISSTDDDEGSMTTFGIGLKQSEKLSFELYGGKIDGFGSSTTVTATNAVIWGNTINGSLTLSEDISSDFYGVDSVFTNKIRFKEGAELTYFGKVGLVSYEIKDAITVSGSGTVNGVSYSGTEAITIKENGIAPSLSAGVAFAPTENLNLSIGISYINNVGGGDLVSADITAYNLGLSLGF
jgi:hypothetical protein